MVQHGAPNGRPVKILLVDDHEENLLALEVILETADLALVRAHSGAEALRFLLRDSFAVTIPAEAPPGLYTAEVGLWDPSRRVRLRRGWFGKSAVDAFQIRVSE